MKTPSRKSTLRNVVFLDAYAFIIHSDTCFIFFPSTGCRRDDLIGTVEFPISDTVDGINGEFEMHDAEGNSIGTVDVNINFEEGDVGMFDLLGSMLHKDD